MRSIIMGLVAGTALGIGGVDAGLSAPAYGEEGAQGPVAGLDLAGMDRTIGPGDDFFSYANGRWLETVAIPDGRQKYGVFDQLAETSNRRGLAIVERLRSDPQSRVGRAYGAYLDTTTIESRGLAPIRPWLARINALSHRADYSVLLGAADRDGISGPFSIVVMPDQGKPGAYQLWLSQAGLGMPNCDCYASDAPSAVQAREVYAAHLAHMLELVGEPNAVARAKAVLDFEIRIASVSWTRAQIRDLNRRLNRTALVDLVDSAPKFDFAAYLSAAGYGVTSLNVMQPDAVRAIAEIIATTPLSTLRDQLIVRSLDQFADVLPKAIDDAHFAFFDRFLRGATAPLARRARAFRFVSEHLTDEIAKPYLAETFDTQSRDATTAIAANVRAAMRDAIEKASWMTPETKARAQAKLARLDIRLGGPSQWHEYAGLEVAADDAFGNKARAYRWHTADDAAKLGAPLRRWEWGMTPMTANIASSPQGVENLLPAAVLQPPFFDAGADAAVNYGAIGVAMARSVASQFDVQASYFDEQGKQESWWSSRDHAQYDQLTTKLIAQYDAYEPIPGQHVNGRMTLGENLDDLAGMAIGLDAYHRSLRGKPALVINGLSGDQRFYLAWAQVWRVKYREATLRNQLRTDPHAPGAFRVAAVRNMDSWYAAFGIKPGDKMYLKPEDRVRIW